MCAASCGGMDDNEFVQYADLLEQFEEIVKILLVHGANAKDTNYSGISVLTYAVEKGSIKVVELLLEYGADANVCNSEGKSLIEIALERNNLSMAVLLKKFGAILSANFEEKD